MEYNRYKDGSQILVLLIIILFGICPILFGLKHNFDLKEKTKNYVSIKGTSVDNKIVNTAAEDTSYALIYKCIH